MLLTIAIPVLNQSQDLIQTLRSIQAIDLFVDSRVEILISDNCSSDETPLVAQEWVTAGKNVRAFSQKENLGFCGNFDFLAKNARGEYLWVIGAGDELTGNNLDALFSWLELEKPDWAIVNGDYSKIPSNDATQTVQIGNSKNLNKVPVFNHAISLNIMKTEIARSRKKPEVSFVKSSLPERKTKNGKFDIWSGETRYWPHLESLAQKLEKKTDAHLSWMFFGPKTVQLDKNNHGSWDRGFSAMKIYAQWSEVVRMAWESCPNAQWLGNLSFELENMHLVRMAFLVRKDGNIPRREMMSIVRSIPGTKIKFKFLTWLVICCPTWLARFAALARQVCFTTLGRAGKEPGTEK